MMKNKVQNGTRRLHHNEDPDDRLPHNRNCEAEANGMVSVHHRAEIGEVIGCIGSELG